MKNQSNEAAEYKVVISAKRRVFDLGFKELFGYRDLIILFVKRSFISKYKQTVLGPLWAVIQPLLSTVVFTVVFGSLAGLTTADGAATLNVPSFLFYMSGTIVWSYFSSVVNATSNTFLSNSHLMGKVYFPRLVMPISTALSNLISFAIQLALFVLIYVFCLLTGKADAVITPYLALLPLIVLQLMLLAMSFGVIVSSLTTKYRDLAMLVGFGLQLWQYATPVAYGLRLIPERYLSLYMLNPVTPPLLAFRYACFGAGFFDIGYYLIGWAVTLVLFFVSVLLFNRIEKTFMDTI